MQALSPLTSPDEVAGPWCNADARTSATIEAISFVTPALERFFIRTVADCLPLAADPDLERRCREFIREEAEHTGAHRQLNGALLVHLGSPPPGLAGVDRLLAGASRHLSLAGRVALVAALEHLTAVLSKSYLARQDAWCFQCAYARDLFLRHAHEEIAHRAVAFDLWQQRGGGNIGARLVSIGTIMAAGAAYLCRAVPWLLYRKCNRRLGTTLAALLRRHGDFKGLGATIVELLRYVRPNYHPRHLVS
jgi:predicted metal-dependent hydrolase